MNYFYNKKLLNYRGNLKLKLRLNCWKIGLCIFWVEKYRSEVWISKYLNFDFSLATNFKEFWLTGHARFLLKNLKLNLFDFMVGQLDCTFTKVNRDRAKLVVYRIVKSGDLSFYLISIHLIFIRNLPTKFIMIGR